MLQQHFPGLRLITFDLDDTLWPCRQTIMRAEQALFEWLQEAVPRLAAEHSVESMRAHRRELASREPAIAHDMTLLRQRHLELLLAEYQYDTALAPVATEFFQQHRNRVEPYAEVEAVLLQLREQYTLVSVTNGNAQVHKTPLAGLFHHSLTAADVGHAKPHPAMFQRAFELTGTTPGSALHVGDDAARDIEPALATGMHAVHVIRGEPAACGHDEGADRVVEAVPRITSLEQLLDTPTKAG